MMMHPLKQCFLCSDTKFKLETDHKPLVPLLSTKDLAELPARIQRFKMRLMRFDFSNNDLMSRKKQANVLSAGMHFLGPCPKSTRYLLSVNREAASSTM
jgi:hypothetical protein